MRRFPRETLFSNSSSSSAICTDSQVQRLSDSLEHRPGRQNLKRPSRTEDTSKRVELAAQAHPAICWTAILVGAHEPRLGRLFRLILTWFRRLPHECECSSVALRIARRLSDPRSAAVACGPTGCTETIYFGLCALGVRPEALLVLLLVGLMLFQHHGSHTARALQLRRPRARFGGRRA